MKHKTPVQVSIVIPAFNEAAVIGAVVGQIRSVLDAQNLQYEILVVDDGSSDDTAIEAEAAGARVVHHPYNLGNGAAVKTGIRNARGINLVLMDGDGQHNPKDIPRMLEMLESYDMVVGARTRGSDTELHRDLANWVYNGLATYICGRKIDDLTSGFRAIKANVARGFVYLLPNTFSYPTTMTLSVVRSGHSLAYLPIVINRRVGKSKIKLLKDGLRFLLIILKIATFYSPLKIFIPMALSILFLGIAYGIFRIVVLDSRYGQTSALLISTAFLTFSVGLISEQVAQLRFDRSEHYENPLQEPEDQDS